MSKEMWFREMERIYNEKLDAGLPDARAYAEAGIEAQFAVTDRLADIADRVRKRMREEGW